MKAGDAVLEVVFEVDVNGILKVTATEKTSGRSANITISNSVGKLSSAEIEKMVDGMFLFCLSLHLTGHFPHHLPLRTRKPDLIFSSFRSRRREIQKFR